MTKYNHLIETQNDEKLVFSGNFLKLKEANVKLPDGTTAIREYFEHPGASAIIAITPDNKIIIEAQFRYPVKQVMLEIPAGKIDLNESTLAAAKRELLEETGYIATDWKEIGYAYPCIAYSTEKITYFVAKNAVFTKNNLDKGEFLEIELLTLDQLTTLVKIGKITDSKTLTGLIFYQEYLKSVV